MMRFCQNMKKSFRMLLMMAVLTVALASCERKPLYLVGGGNVELDVAIYDIRLSLLWGLNWETEWQYDWADEYGEIGYTRPDYVRAIMYNVDQFLGKRENPQTRNFAATGGMVSLLPGSMYDMLFYNSGYEYIQVLTDDDNTYYKATTRRSNTKAYSKSKAAAEESGDDSQYVDYNQPDEFFGTFLSDLWVSDNTDDYEQTVAEDGTIVYLYRVNASLRPYSMIYLYQIMVINNEDSIGNKIVGAQGYTVTGLSNEVNMFNRMNDSTSVSVSSEVVRPLIDNKMLTLPDGTQVQGDIMASRMLTWGLSGISPLDEADKYIAGETKSGNTKSRADEVNPVDDNYINIGVTLRNGATKVISKNITEQMNNHPAGGVITVVIDAAQEISASDLNGGSGSKGGGFSADVNDWGNSQDAEITI